jgi:hypothetical protein
VRLVLKIVMQNDGDCVDVILLYWGLKHWCVFSSSTDSTVLWVVSAHVFFLHGQYIIMCSESVEWQSSIWWVVLGFLS